VRLISSSSGSNWRVKDFSIQGSNNDSSWDTLYTGQYADSFSWQSFTFENSTAYRYYKINITSLWGAANSAVIGEIQMMETA
jgi:hypothetical protein